MPRVLRASLQSVRINIKARMPIFGSMIMFEQCVCLPFQVCLCICNQWYDEDLEKQYQFIFKFAQTQYGINYVRSAYSVCALIIFQSSILLKYQPLLSSFIITSSSIYHALYLPQMHASYTLATLVQLILFNFRDSRYISKHFFL